MVLHPPENFNVIMARLHSGNKNSFIADSESYNYSIRHAVISFNSVFHYREVEQFSCEITPVLERMADKGLHQDHMPLQVTGFC